MNSEEISSAPGAPNAPALNKLEHRFTYRGWEIAVQLDGMTRDGCVSGHADLNAGAYRCRVVFASPHYDGASALQALARRARDLVDDREALAATIERRPDGGRVDGAGSNTDS